MAATGGTTSYSPISLLTGTALLPKTTTVAKPVTTAARPASTSAPVSLSNPVLKPVSTMSGSSGSAASSASRPSSTSVKPPAYSGLDQALAQRYVAPAQQAQRIADAWETGTFLPTQRNTITGETRPAVPGMLQTVFDNLMLPVRAAQAVPGALQSAYSAFKLPGDVLAGRNQNFTPGYATQGGIADALNFVGNFAGAGSVVPRPANSLGMLGLLKTPNVDKEAIRWAENEAISRLPNEFLLNQMGQTGVARAVMDKELDDIALQSGGVRPYFRYDPVAGKVVPYNSVIPLSLPNGLSLDLSRLPSVRPGVDPEQNKALWTTLDKVSNVSDLSRNVPGIGGWNIAQFDPVYLDAEPDIGARFVFDKNLMLINPRIDPKTQKMVFAHDLAHNIARQVGGETGTNPVAAGSPYNYFIDLGEQLGRISGVLGPIPAAKQSLIPASMVRDLANYEPRLMDPAHTERIGVPANPFPFTQPERAYDIQDRINEIMASPSKGSFSGPTSTTSDPFAFLRNMFRR